MKGYATLCVLFFSYNDFKSFFLSGLLKYDIAKLKGLPILKSFADKKLLCLKKKKRYFLKEWKKLWEKDKMLVTKVF